MQGLSYLDLILQIKTEPRNIFSFNSQVKSHRLKIMAGCFVTMLDIKQESFLKAS